MDERNTHKTDCNLIMENRSKLSISAVSDVDSFDESTVVLSTELGVLMVKGADLHINKLNVDTGELIIEGEIDSCVFNDGYSSKGGGGFLARMFK